MTGVEVRALAQAWERRRQRIPATFKTYGAYLSAVEGGLLEREPETSAAPVDLPKLLAEIEAAESEVMPAWQPRPQGPTCFNLRVLTQSDDKLNEED